MRQSQHSLPWDISNVAIPSSSSAAALGCSYELIRVSGSGRAPGGENGKPLQYPCLENPMDRGAWRDTVPKSWTRLRWLSMHGCEHDFQFRLWHLAGFCWTTMQVPWTPKCVPFHVLLEEAKPTLHTSFLFTHCPLCEPGPSSEDITYSHHWSWGSSWRQQSLRASFVFGDLETKEGPGKYCVECLFLLGCIWGYSHD